MDSIRCLSSKTIKQLYSVFSLLAGLSLGLFLFVNPISLYANDFEDGKEAYLAKNYAKALKILTPLAENGNSQAQVTIGIMYDFGQGVETNPVEAFKWYKLAAEQGIPIVQHDLGVKYFQGVGTEQNFLEAAKWWEMSANAGLPDSQFNLGLMYYRGIGLAQNFIKAESLFSDAAEQGHGHAQYSLAVMYAFAQGVEKNYDKALDWFNKAADQNIAQAQYNLGVFYENGYGIEKNLETARTWYELAQKQNLPEAKEKLASLDSAVQEVVETEINPVIEEPVAIVEEDAPEIVDTPAVSENTMDIRVNDIKREDWVRNQRSDSFTIQIGSGIREKDIVAFLKANQLQSNSAYIRVFVKGSTRYSALYGAYPSYSDAQAAISSLPKHIQASKPWVRNFGVLQEMLDKSNG